MSCWEFWPRSTPARCPVTPTNSTRRIWESSKSRCVYRWKGGRRPLQLSYLKTYARVCDRSCRPVFLFSDDLFDEGTQTFCCSWMFERTRVSYGQLHENDGRRWAALFHKSWCLYGSCTMVRDRCASLTCRPCNIQGDFSICPKGHQPSGKCLNKSLE